MDPGDSLTVSPKHEILSYSGSRATEVHGNVPLPKAGAHFHTSLA